MTAHSLPAPIDSASLTCDSCLCPGAVPLPHRPGNLQALCPGCTARTALIEASAAHLHGLIWPAVTAWARHWHRVGVDVRELAGVLEMEGVYWHPMSAFARDGSSYQNAHEVVTEALEVEA